jgi:Uma2 family endonuclease
MIDPAMLASERLRPLRREEYDRLVELGYFDDEKVELLDGMLVAVSPQGAGHWHAIGRLNVLFVRAVGDRAMVRIQAPLATSDDSEPEPDVALVPNQEDSHEHPTRALLVVEVAQSSLRKDRLLKAALYARAGVPEYWIVNLAERVVEVYREPQGDRYSSMSTHPAGEILRPVTFPDIEIPIADVLPTLR